MFSPIENAIFNACTHDGSVCRPLCADTKFAWKKNILFFCVVHHSDRRGQPHLTSFEYIRVHRSIRIFCLSMQLLAENGSYIAWLQIPTWLGIWMKNILVVRHIITIFPLSVYKIPLRLNRIYKLLPMFLLNM